jgi:hypothetical protein
VADPLTSKALSLYQFIKGVVPSFPFCWQRRRHQGTLKGPKNPLYAIASGARWQNLLIRLP